MKRAELQRRYAALRLQFFDAVERHNMRRAKRRLNKALSNRPSDWWKRATEVETARRKYVVLASQFYIGIARDDSDGRRRRLVDVWRWQGEAMRMRKSQPEVIEVALAPSNVPHIDSKVVELTLAPMDVTRGLRRVR